MDKKINITKCIICNNIIDESKAFGNNPAPVAKMKDGPACDNCFTEIVLPARLSLPEFQVNFKNIKK
jgi:hypothetical protein|tara:strand:- start:534 stop:734 length:201 start_codon:yes stop_codon:yes gene_type:complete